MMIASESEMVFFSVRVPKEFGDEIKSFAKLSKSQNVSQYIRDAVREKNEREFAARMKTLSQRLGAASLAENRAMEGSIGDGLGAA